MSDLVPLVYILSSGRSGTTLLDMLLGSSPTVWTVGEAQLLPWELREKRAPCGCGRNINECPFWRELLPELPLDVEDYPIDYFRETHGAGRVFRWSLVLDIACGHPAQSRFEALQQYGRVNAEYLSSVCEHARKTTGRNVAWMVDASMDLYRLIWLYWSGLFRIRVIHLTKAPEAFVFWMLEEHESVADKFAVRMAGRWFLENLLMIWICRRIMPEGTWRHVKYEELAAGPSGYREEMSSWLDVNFASWKERSFRAYTNHAVSGNKMRWEETEVRLDERWKDQMATINKQLARVLTRPVARQLGY